MLLFNVQAACTEEACSEQTNCAIYIICSQLLLHFKLSIKSSFKNDAVLLIFECARVKKRLENL